MKSRDGLPWTGRVNVGSLFSGIGGMDYGLHAAGHRHVFFCESDGWRREVLAARWPGVPIWDDVRDVDVRAEVRAERARRAGAGSGDAVEGPVGTNGQGGLGGVDLLCGGFPCQDLSVAGKRAGLAGSRSGLFHEFARIIDAFRPGHVLIENVPGLLSSNGGRDFGVVVGTLADLGYGVGWRVLDSRFFGVPQRRRRVFIVGARADGDPAGAAHRASEVLAVGSRCDRHPPEGTQTGQRTSDASSVSTLTASGKGRGYRIDAEYAAGGHLVPMVSKALKKTHGWSWKGADHETYVVSEQTERSIPDGDWVEAERAEPIRGSHDLAIAADPSTVEFPSAAANAQTGAAGAVPPAANERLAVSGVVVLDNAALVADEPPRQGDQSSSLLLGSRRSLDVSAQEVHRRDLNTFGVRRLTPVECERLQGLPDGWTQLDAKSPDSRRYSGLGDAVTATVAEWIGRRLEASANQ